MAVALAAFFAALICASAKSVGGRSFGDDYEWHDLAGGLEAARTTGKPIMYVFHKSWCGACKNLAPKFAASDDIKAQASKFIMINLVDDEHPEDEKYRPDGAYIPRIFFGAADGSVDHSIYNKNGSPQYKYFYSDPAGIASAMAAAAKKV